MVWYYSTSTPGTPLPRSLPPSPATGWDSAVRLRLSGEVTFVICGAQDTDFLVMAPLTPVTDRLEEGYDVVSYGAFTPADTAKRKREDIPDGVCKDRKFSSNWHAGASLFRRDVVACRLAQRAGTVYAPMRPFAAGRDWLAVRHVHPSRRLRPRHVRHRNG